MLTAYAMANLVLALTISVLPAAPLTGDQEFVIDNKKGPPPFPIRKVEQAAGDSELTALLKARFNERLAVVVAVHHEVAMGRVLPPAMIGPLSELSKAGMEAHGTNDKKKMFLTQLLVTAEDIAHKVSNPDRWSDVDRHRANAFVLDIRIEILRLKAKDAKPK